MVQVKTSLQLFETLPHALPMHAAVLSGTQQPFGPAPPTPHLVVGVQRFRQVVGWPQLLVTGPQDKP